MSLVLLLGLSALAFAVTYPGPPAKATWYYRRIDEVSASGTTSGVVWSFKTK